LVCAQILSELEDPKCRCRQGYYETDPNGSVFCARDGTGPRASYSGIKGRETGHVCTGNTAYRADAIEQVGFFDESLGYGYDNDMSYRLHAAGYQLRLSRDARSRHQWREGPIGYAVQQYGFGYGRLDLVAKHPSRVTGDSVSPARMMAHPLLLGLALLAFMAASWLSMIGGRPQYVVVGASAIVAGLIAERLAAGVQAAWRSQDLAGLWFPVVHLVRDLAWVTAIVVWVGRRIAGLRSRPENSMVARRGSPKAIVAE
jgi:hypothetical protein